MRGSPTWKSNWITNLIKFLRVNWIALSYAAVMALLIYYIFSTGRMCLCLTKAAATIHRGPMK